MVFLRGHPIKCARKIFRKILRKYLMDGPYWHMIDVFNVSITKKTQL